MFEPKLTITNKINNSLLEIERSGGFLEAAKLKEEWIILIEKAMVLRLNDRQQNIVLYLLDKKQASFEDIGLIFDLVRRIVQRDLSKLIDLGLIRQIAISKTDPTKYYELL